MRNALLILVTVLLLSMAVAHGFVGGAGLRQLLDQTHAGAELDRTATGGWWFGSVCMAAFSAIAAIAAVRSRRGDASLDAALRVVGVAFAAFGAGAMIFQGPSGHYAGFILVGALVACATLKKPALPAAPTG